MGWCNPGAVHNYVVLGELCPCRSFLSLATATLLGKCSSFSRSGCPAQVSRLALILVTMSKDGTKYPSLISVSVINASLLVFHAPTHLVTFSVIGQASLPYTRTEATAVAYNLNFSVVSSSLLPQQFSFFYLSSIYSNDRILFHLHSNSLSCLETAQWFKLVLYLPVSELSLNWDLGLLWSFFCAWHFTSEETLTFVCDCFPSVALA